MIFNCSRQFNHRSSALRTPFLPGLSTQEGRAGSGFPGVGCSTSQDRLEPNWALGWLIEQTHNVIDQLLDSFPVAEEVSQIFPTWLNLVTENQVKGKRTHDARLVAVMFASGVSHILTLNPNNFYRKLECWIHSRLNNPSSMSLCLCLLKV